MSWSRSSGGFETERLYGKVETEEGDQGVLVRYFRVVDTLGTISDRTVRWVAMRFYGRTEKSRLESHENDARTGMYRRLLFTNV